MRSRLVGVVAVIASAVSLAACGDRKEVADARDPNVDSATEPGILHCGLGNEPDIVGSTLSSGAPARIPSGESSAFWSTWRPSVGPGGVGGGDSGVPAVVAWTARPVDAWSGISTPLGLFVYRVAAVDHLRTTDGTRVVAVCLSFDPRQRASGLLPLGPEDQAILRGAIESNLLTHGQRAALETMRNGYLVRWKTFQEHWVRFVEAPRNDALRDQFLDALVALPGDVMSLAQHERFLSRPQRVALRAAGHVIDGAAWSADGEGGRRIFVRDFPAGVFAERWNTLPAFLGLPDRRPRVEVVEGAAFEEIDFELLLPQGGEAEQVARAARALGTVAQLRVLAEVRGP